MRLFDLSGRVALVTGASAGIGRAISEALAEAGATVAVAARRAPQLAETVASVTENGGRAHAVTVDLERNDAIRQLVTEVSSKLGEPDILVNCAGVNLREPSDRITDESWNRTVNINLKVPFFLARELIPGMKRKGWGRVINIASLQSRRAFPDSIPYGASKGGIEQLTRAMAEAWSRDGINCNAIAPGFFPTDLTRAVFDDPDRRDWAANQTAIGRNGALEDLHGTAIFLASKASDYVTGQTIFVDGGFTAR
ncbi:MAG: SDR family NAD(P)-dependent oxidoreductase [Proteobacteria bacterium]|nr:MAG: SDR family NAD(P)-dependent oxidoreductase [Pseudomonadota bacterium]